MKETNEITYSWINMLFPLYLGLLLFIFYFSQIIFKSLTGRYRLRPQQLLLLGGYSLSLCMILLGTGLTTFDSYYQQLVYVNHAYISWTIAITLAGSCSISVLYAEGIETADSRGYTQPRVLSRTSQGWDIIEVETNPLLFLLGEVDFLSQPSRYTPPSRKETEGIEQKSKLSLPYSYQQGKFLKNLRKKEKKEGPGEVEVKSFQ